MALNKTKVITVTSVKGGSGKSTLTLSLAAAFSKKKLKTIILDLDLTSGVIAPSLNINPEEDIYSLVDDMMNGRFKQIEKYIRNYNEYIDIIPTLTDPRNANKIPAQYIENIIRQLEYKYDIILIDTSNQTSNTNLAAFDNTDIMLYVINGDLMELKNMKTMISIYKDMDLDKYKIILNQSLNKGMDKYEIENVLERQIDYIIKKDFYEPNIQKYIYEGKIFSLEKSKKLSIINGLIDEIIK